MFIGTIWALTHERHMRSVNRLITAVAVLLFVLSTAVSFSPYYLMLYAEVLQAHGRRHYSD